MSDLGALTAGRPLSLLEPPFVATDRTFASVRLDDREVLQADYRHCTFTQVSFKEATIRGGRFLDCVFVRCYFRRAELASTSFVGCRFIDCNFSYVAVKGSRFEYSTFYGCQIAYDELRHSFPSQSNVREDLAHNLSVASGSLGLMAEAGRYRMAAIRAHEEHLLAGIQASSQWYQEHFDGPRRVQAVYQLTASLVNRWLWRYGESVRQLLAVAMLFGVIVFPLAYALAGPGLHHGDGSLPSLGETVLYSLVTMIPAGIGLDVEATALSHQLIAFAEALFGLVVAALVASYVVRWSLRR
jgi:hypothetical protein